MGQWVNGSMGQWVNGSPGQRVRSGRVGSGRVGSGLVFAYNNIVVTVGWTLFERLQLMWPVKQCPA
jgi:hypothetical protein